MFQPVEQTPRNEIAFSLHVEGAGKVDQVRTILSGYKNIFPPEIAMGYPAVMNFSYQNL